MHPARPTGTFLRAVRATLLLAAFAATGAQAAQVKVIDTTYTHTENNRPLNPLHDVGESLKSSHAALDFTAEQPSDWTTPVDYRQGELYVVVDVLSKPTAITTKLATCFIQASYTCSNSVPFTQPGHYEQHQPATTWYQYNLVDWTKPFKFVTSILRDPNNKKLDVGQGFLNEPDLSAYLPLTVRVRVFAVSQGASFVLPVETLDAGTVDAGPEDGGSLPPDDAGTVDAGNDDAGVEADAGGMIPDDAGTADAGPDAGAGNEGDAGLNADAPSAPTVEGGCQSAPWPALVGGLGWLLVAARRRARNRGGAPAARS